MIKGAPNDINRKINLQWQLLTREKLVKSFLQIKEAFFINVFRITKLFLLTKLLASHYINVNHLIIDTIIYIYNSRLRFDFYLPSGWPQTWKTGKTGKYQCH